MNYQILKEKADIARKAQNWAETLKYYSQIAELETNNIWDNYFYALALYKNNFTDKSIEICRNIYKIKPLFNPNNSLYALNINKRTFLKINYNNKNIVLKAIKAIKKLIPEDDKYLSFEQVIYKILKKIETEKQYGFLLWILENLSLSDDDYKKLENYEKQNIKHPSYVETWHVVKIRVLFVLKKYNEAIKLVDKALKAVKKFHYNNHIWILRIKALSYAGIFKYDFALQDFFYILRFKNDWFILFEVSQILMNIDNKKAAIYFATKALLDNQNPKFKIKLYSFFAENENNVVAKELLTDILQKIFDENNMKMNRNIQKICENTPQSGFSVNKLDKQIKEQAKKHLYSKEFKGTIFRVFNKFSGLLKTDKGVLFYMVQNKKIELKVKQAVKYDETWNFDVKKMQVRRSALIIKEI